jgi:hypothetical protein
MSTFGTLNYALNGRQSQQDDMCAHEFPGGFHNFFLLLLSVLLLCLTDGVFIPYLPSAFYTLMGHAMSHLGLLLKFSRFPRRIYSAFFLKRSRNKKVGVLISNGVCAAAGGASLPR